MGSLFDMAVRGDKAVHAHCAVLNHPLAIEPRCTVEGHPRGVGTKGFGEAFLKPDSISLRPGFVSVARQRDGFVIEEWLYSCDLKISHHDRSIPRGFFPDWSGAMRIAPAGKKRPKWQSANVVELSPDLFIVMYADLYVSVNLFLEKM